jgi:hypothetical protein
MNYFRAPFAKRSYFRSAVREAEPVWVHALTVSNKPCWGGKPKEQTMKDYRVTRLDAAGTDAPEFLQLLGARRVVEQPAAAPNSGHAR